VPRKTNLSIISERPFVDEGAVVNATADLVAAAPHSLAPPDDILAALRAQNAHLTQLVSDTASRAENAEIALHQTTAAAASEREQIQRSAHEQVARMRADAASAINAAQKQSAVAEKTAVAAERVRQTVGTLGSLIGYLVDRAPVLATLLGAYFLARDMLPTPGAMQLGLLGIYGMTAVLPATFWSLRRG
jgi:hypothetical protein